MEGKSQLRRGRQTAATASLSLFRGGLFCYRRRRHHHYYVVFLLLFYACERIILGLNLLRASFWGRRRRQKLVRRGDFLLLCRSSDLYCRHCKPGITDRCMKEKDVVTSQRSDYRFAVSLLWRQGNARILQEGHVWIQLVVLSARLLRISCEFSRFTYYYNIGTTLPLVQSLCDGSRLPADPDLPLSAISPPPPLSPPEKFPVEFWSRSNLDACSGRRRRRRFGRRRRC